MAIPARMAREYTRPRGHPSPKGEAGVGGRGRAARQCWGARVGAAEVPFVLWSQQCDLSTLIVSCSVVSW